MAVMNAAQRQAAVDEFIGDLNRAREPIAVIKADLAAAVAAVDQWASDNAASLNAAIPQPARANLTASQKARILRYVIKQRFVSGV
jgi:hypothetical protein